MLLPKKISQGWTPKRWQWSSKRAVSFCFTSQVSPHLSASVGNVSHKELLHSTSWGEEHRISDGLQRPQSPDSVATPEQPFTDSCRFPELDGIREEEAKQSSAKHKNRHLRSTQSLSLRFSLYSEGTKKWRPRGTHSTVWWHLWGGASKSEAIPLLSSVFLAPRRCSSFN